MSETQSDFKPDSAKWPVAEVLEHLGVYEEPLYWRLMNNQYTDERPDLVSKVKGIDSAMLAYATDPAKGQVPFSVQPLGRFRAKEQLVNYFNRFRNEVIKFVIQQLQISDFTLSLDQLIVEYGISGTFTSIPCFG